MLNPIFFSCVSHVQDGWHIEGALIIFVDGEWNNSDTWIKQFIGGSCVLIGPQHWLL